MKSGDCELCPSKTAGNKNPWKSEAWQQLPSTIIFNISSLPQDVIPGCDRRSVLCIHLFPTMNLSTVMGRESGNEVEITSGWGVPLQTDFTHLDVQRLCITRAIWSELILTSFTIIWWGLTVASLSEILGKPCKLNPCQTSFSLSACKPNWFPLYPSSLLLLVCHTACSAIGEE